MGEEEGEVEGGVPPPLRPPCRLVEEEEVVVVGEDQLPNRGTNEEACGRSEGV